MPASPLIFDSDKCTDCRACEELCTFVHYKLYNRNKSGIRIDVRWPEATRAYVCHQCEDTPCAEACPTEALYVTPEGVVKFNAEECINCEACIEACPYDAIWVDPTTDWIIKCDTCDGEYSCVEWCPVGALAIAVPEEVR